MAIHGHLLLTETIWGHQVKYYHLPEPEAEDLWVLAELEPTCESVCGEYAETLEKAKWSIRGFLSRHYAKPVSQRSNPK